MDSSETPYSGLTDEEFRQELRRQMNDRSWNLGHWEELERRNDNFSYDDPELEEAVSEELRRFNEALRQVLAPVQRRLAAH